MTSRRAMAVAAAVLLVVASCRSSPDDRDGPAADLLETARSADSLNHKVEYTYTLLGPLSGAVKTRMTRVLRPPDDLRKVEVTTQPEKGSPVTVVAWYIRKKDAFYSCTAYGEIECRAVEGRRGLFGFAQVDQLFDAARTKDGFATVEKGPNRTIAGEQATCFAARTVPPPAGTSDPSVTPRYEPDKFRVELCYARDGVPLRIFQSATGPVPSGANRLESVLEATSVSRTVAAADTELPGPLVGVGATPPPE